MKLETKAKDHTTIVKQLKQQLKDAQTAGDAEAAEKVQEQLRQSNLEVFAHSARIKELEAELKKKLAKEVVERVPESIEQELASLRATVAKQAQSKAAAKFTVHFDALVKSFTRHSSSSLSGATECGLCTAVSFGGYKIL